MNAVIPATNNDFGKTQSDTSLENITKKIDKTKIAEDFSPKLVDEIIHEFHQKDVLWTGLFAMKLYRKATHPATNVAPLSRGEFVFLKSFD